jgi:hypothetical protein
VSIENMTPEPARSERTIRWTPTESEAVVLAIGDRPIGEQRGEAALDRGEQLRLAANIEEGLELTREARLRQILGGGAAADRDVRILALELRRHVAIGARDRVRERPWKVATRDQLADRLADRVQVAAVVLELAELVRDLLAQLVGVDELPIGRGGGREAAWNADVRLPQAADHLAERGVLAADLLAVLPAEVGKPKHKRSIRHDRKTLV